MAAARAAGTAGAAPSGWNRLVDGVVQLGWPTVEEAARPARRVAIPDSFASSQQYVQAWTNALLEELNLRWAGWGGVENGVGCCYVAEARSGVGTFLACWLNALHDLCCPPAGAKMRELSLKSTCNLA